MLRSFLLAPCLLICLSCATPTPSPFESLEEGMTMVQATEAFGEASSTSMEELHDEVLLLQEENARILERLESAVGLSETRGPVARMLEESSTQTLRSLEQFVAELVEASGEQGVRSTWVYPYYEFSWKRGGFVKMEVELLFEGNNLASWETRLAPSVPTTDTYAYDSDLFETRPWPFPDHSKKDTQHHKKGHEHHHPDDP